MWWLNSYLHTIIRQPGLLNKKKTLQCSVPVEFWNELAGGCKNWDFSNIPSFTREISPWKHQFCYFVSIFDQTFFSQWSYSYTAVIKVDREITYFLKGSQKFLNSWHLTEEQFVVIGYTIFHQ